MKFLTHLIHLFLLLPLFLFSPTEISAQERPDCQDSLVRALVSDGFENVGIYREKRDVYLFFENRRYRWEIDGLSRVLKKAAMAYGDSTILHVVPLHHDVPVIVVNIGVKAYKEQHLHPMGNSFQNGSVNASLNTDSVNYFRKKIRLQNRTLGRTCTANNKYPLLINSCV